VQLLGSGLILLVSPSLRQSKDVRKGLRLPEGSRAGRGARTRQQKLFPDGPSPHSVITVMLVFGYFAFLAELVRHITPDRILTSQPCGPTYLH